MKASDRLFFFFWKNKNIFRIMCRSFSSFQPCTRFIFLLFSFLFTVKILIKCLSNVVMVSIFFFFSALPWLSYVCLNLNSPWDHGWCLPSHFEIGWIVFVFFELRFFLIIKLSNPFMNFFSLFFFFFACFALIVNWPAYFVLFQLWQNSFILYVRSFSCIAGIYSFNIYFLFFCFFFFFVMVQAL